MAEKTIDFSKEINAINSLLDTKFENNPFRAYIVAETFNIALSFAKLHFSTTPILFYCSHIVHERAKITNWRKNVPQSIILACDLPLLFAQNLAVSQFVFQKVNEQHSSKEHAYKHILNFLNKEHQKFFNNTPKNWKIANQIDKEIEQKDNIKKVNSLFLKNSPHFEEFTMDYLLKQFHQGVSPAHSIIKTIINLAFEAKIKNNDIELESDFLLIKELLLQDDNFTNMPYQLNISADMFYNPITQELLKHNQNPIYEDEESHLRAIQMYSLMEDEAIYATDIDFDVIPAILDEEKRLIENGNKTSDIIRDEYLKIYFKKEN